MKTNKKMKVAHVLKSSIYSGAESIVLTIIKELWNEFDFLYISSDGPIRDKLEQEQVPYALLEQFSRKELSKAIDTFKPDLIHAHDFSASVLCATLTGKFRLISHLHCNPTWSGAWNLKTAVYTLASARMARILTVSDCAYRSMIFSGILQRKSIIVANPVDIRKIEKDSEQAGEKKIYDLLFVGRLVKEKNPQLFIEIVNQLWQENCVLRCLMIGDGDLRKECQQLINQYGLESVIELAGFQENPYQYMKEAKMLCMTSCWEGYGLVAAEANALGVPVISTRTSGLRSLFGEHAIELCEGKKEFCEKIQILLNDDMEYERWKNRALDRKRDMISVESYGVKIGRMYSGF